MAVSRTASRSSRVLRQDDTADDLIIIDDDEEVRRVREENETSPRTVRERYEQLQERRRRGPSRTALFLFVCILTLLIVPLIAWGLVGTVLTSSSTLISTVGWLITVGLYLGAQLSVASLKTYGLSSYSFRETLIDVPAALSLALLVIALLKLKGRSLSKWIYFLPSVLNLAFVITKACLLTGWNEVQSLVDATLAFSALTPMLASISLARLWRPVSIEQLEGLESKLLNQGFADCPGVKFELKMIAGLGTVHVPYQPAEGTAGAAGKEEREREGNVNGKGPDVLVLIHGYAAGNGFWLKNLGYFARHYEVYAVEWPAFGRSIRQPFKGKTFEDGIDYFVKAYEQWRQALGLSKFVLCGHSMGAIIGTHYTLKYPEYVSHFILASPAGVNPRPDASAMSSSTAYKVLRAVWNTGVSPMSLVRFMGPLGRVLMKSMARRRLEWMPERSYVKSKDADLESFTEYMYQNWALAPGSDLALSVILQPGAWAQKPLSDVIVPGAFRCPLTFMYGGGPDWMSKEHGLRVVKLLAAHGDAAEYLLVPEAGHQVFLDNPDAFNELIHDTIEKMRSKRVQ